MAQKGSNKWVSAAHIKKGTQGSFNQVSFSVLDAKSQAVANEQGEAPRKILGVVPLFTLNSKGETSSSAVPSKTLLQGGSAGGAATPESKAAPAHQRPKDQSLSVLAKSNAAALEPFEARAVEKRSARIRRRVLVGSLVAAVVLSFVGYGAFSLYNNMQYEDSQFSTINQALSLIADADQDLTSLNDLLAEPNKEGAKTQFEALTKKLPQTKLSLQRAKSMIEHGSESLTDSKSKELASRSQRAIEARMDMMGAGEPLAALVAAALSASDDLSAAWDLMFEADAKARGASSLLLNPTDENLDQALSGTQFAIYQFDQVSGLLSTVADRMDVDVSAYREYVDKRKEALAAAKVAIEKLMEKDTDAARAAQDSYAKADNAAAALAAKLPKDPAAYVFQAYQSKSQELIDAYSKARSEAGIADSMLREYYASQHK